jgi:hypothetical protein
MPNDRLSLDQIGLRAGTDKSSAHHDYLNFYEPFFAPWRDRAPRVLEIGIFNGASLETWASFFEHGAIIGADIDPGTRRLATDRVAIEILDQGNVEGLVRLGVKHGPFDLVIEDGSHMWEHQITTLRTMFPFVRDGGLYVVEDLQTNYGTAAAVYRGAASLSCVEYLKMAVDLRVADGAIDINAQEDAFLRTYARAMTLSFYRGCCLIQKRFGRHGAEAASGEPILSAEHSEAALPLCLVAHIGGQGDAPGACGSVQSLDQRQNIQGFVLRSAEPAAAQLQYRARLDDGSWTPWVEAGAFAGTKGQSRDLTGFAVRSRDVLSPKLSIRAVGLFRGETGAVSAHEGKDCTPAAGLGKLHGMQVIVRPAST